MRKSRLANRVLHRGAFTCRKAKAATCRCAVLLLLAAAAVSCYSNSTDDDGARDCRATLAPLVQRCSSPRDAAASEVQRLLRLEALSCLLSQEDASDMELRICAPNQSSQLIYAESASLLSSALPPSANTSSGLPLAFRLRVAGCDELYNASWWWNISADWQRVGAIDNVQPAAPEAGPLGVVLAPAYIMQQEGWAGQLLNLMPVMQLDRRLDHTDILLPLRHHVALDPYGGNSALPLDGSMLVMVYRRDVLEAINRQVPQTWDELVDFVDLYDSARPSWAPAAALCTTAGAACDGSELFNAIWYSIAQSAGATQGVHFDPVTMQPRANTAALRAAARLFGQLQHRAMVQPGGTCRPVHPGLRGGGCAIAVGTLEQVKGVAYDDPADGEGQQGGDGLADGSRARGARASAFSVSQLPGSPYVQDPRNSSNLLPCTPDTCPMADTAALQRSPWSTTAQMLAALGLSNGPAMNGAAGPTAVESRRRRNLLGGAQRRYDSAELVRDGTCMQRPCRTHMRGLQQVQERAAARGSPNSAGSGGGQYLVNRVPCVLKSTLAGGVRKGMPPEQQLVAYYALALLADPQTSLRLVVAPGSNLMPSRTSHFGTAARDTWATAGYDRRLVGEALDVLWAAWGSPNLGWGLHMAGGRYYEAALSAFLQRTSPHPASPLPRAAELAVAAESLQQQLAAHYSPAIDYSALYSVFLHGPSGWSRTPQAVPPQPAAQQSGQRAGGAQGSGSGLAGRTTALVVAVAVAVVALVAAAGYVGVKRRWQPCRGLKPKPRLSWRSDAPGAGPRTTLLVTDIEGSTTLWEVLDADVMGRALSLHHACIRHVLVRHRGYESATEGDSFILAFHTPGSALEFALEAQHALLEQEWPEALLAEPVCAAVYTTMPAGFPFKRPQALDAALAGLQRSNLPAGSTPSTPKVFNSSTLARFTSFRNRRLSLSQSPGPAPRGRRHRASIDLGSLPIADGAASLGSAMPLGLEGVSVAAPRWHAYSVSLGDPVALPSCATSLGPTHPGRASLQLRPATGACGALTLLDSPLAQVKPKRDDSRPHVNYKGDGRDGQEPSATLWVSGVQGSTTPRGDQSAARLGGSSRATALPCTPRSQGELARRLQEQQEYLKHQLQLEPQLDAAQSRTSLEEPAAEPLRVCPLSPVLPAASSPTPWDGQVSPGGTAGTASTGSGWAVVHGAEAAQVLHEDSPVARYLLGSTLAAIESAECDSGAVSVPSLVQQRAVAEATSALAAATAAGGVPAVTGDGHAAGKQPQHEPGSAALPVLSVSCRLRRSDTHGGGGGGTPKRVGTWQSAAAASSPTVWASGLTATGGAAAGEAAAAWVVCTLESAFRAAVQAFDSDAAGPVSDRRRHLAFRGLRVRMGLHSGISKASDVADNRASARTVYGGACAGVVRCVSDCAQGGMVLLSDTCVEALDAAAGGSGGVTVGGGAEACLVGLGRYKIKYRDTQVGLYLATSGELASRIALLPPPRSISPIGLSLYHAPIGRAAVAAVHVQDLHMLQEWDAGTTAQALAMLWNVLVEQLAGHRGYLVRKDPDGQLLAVFAFPLDAVRWALTCRTILTTAVDWPPTLLAHELCREADARRVSQGGYHGGLWGMRASGTPYTSAGRNWMAKHLQGASGHLTPHGAVLPKPSLELEASPSPLCDTGRTWLSSLMTGKSSGRQERVSTDGPDRGGMLRGDTCMSVAGSSCRMPYSSTSADLDSAAPNALAKSGTRGLAGCSRGSRRRGMQTLAQAPDSGAASEGVPNGTSPAPGSNSNTPASKHTADSPGRHGWARKLGSSGRLQPRSRASTGGVTDAQRVPASAPVPSTWLQANPLHGPQSRASGCGAYATMAATYCSEAGVASPRSGDIALPAALSLAGASQSTAATEGTAVTGGPAATAGAPSQGGASAGSNLPHSHLTVRTSLEWAGGASDRLGSEAEDGGDVFTAHVGTIEGLGPFGQPPRCSLSGGGPLYSTGATNAVVGCGSDREGGDVQVLRGLRFRIGIDCGHLDWSISSATHSLSYVGGPVQGAERLAQSAGAGQVLASFDVMAQVHSMQSSVHAQHQEDPGGAARAAAAAGSGFQATVCGGGGGAGVGGGGGGGNGGGGGALGPAVVGLPLKVSRALMGSRSRRMLVFACRYTPDWDEALREWELTTCTPCVPGTLSSAHSPKSSVLLSPFTSPWSWSAAAAARWTRRRATAGGAAPLDARSPDTARTESRCSMDALPSGLRTGNCTPLTHALAAVSSARHRSLQGYATPATTKPVSLTASRTPGFPTGAHSARGAQPTGTSRAPSSAASTSRPSLDPASGFGYCVGGAVLPAGSIPGLRPGSTSGAGPLAARLSTAASLPLAQAPFPSPSTALLPGVRSSRPSIGSALPAQACTDTVQHDSAAVARTSAFTSGSLTLRVMRNSVSTSCNVSSKAMPAVAENGGLAGGGEVQADAQQPRREGELKGGVAGLQVQVQKQRPSSLGSGSGGDWAGREVGAGLALGLAPSPLQQALRQHRVQQRAQEQRLQLQQHLQQYVHHAQQLQQQPQSGDSSPSTALAQAAADAVGQLSPGSAPHREPMWPRGHGPTLHIRAAPAASWRASLSLDSCGTEVCVDHQDGSTPSAHAPVGSASPLGSRLRTSIESGRGGSGAQLHSRADSPAATPALEWSTSVSAAAQQSYGGNGGGGTGVASAGQAQAWEAASGDGVAASKAAHTGAAPALVASWASPWLDKGPVSPRPAAAAGQDVAGRDRKPSAEEEGSICGGSPTVGTSTTFGAVWAESSGQTDSRGLDMRPSCFGAGREGAGGVQGDGADHRSGRRSREQHQAQQSSGGSAGACSAKGSPRKRTLRSPSRLSSFVADGLGEVGHTFECISRATVQATIGSEGIAAAAAEVAAAVARRSGSRVASVPHCAVTHGPDWDSAGCAASAALDAGSSANAWDVRGPASSLQRPEAAAAAAAATGGGDATPAGAFGVDYAPTCLGRRPVQPTPATCAAPAPPEPAAVAAPDGRCGDSWLERWLEGQVPHPQRSPCIEGSTHNAMRHSTSFPREPRSSIAPTQPSGADGRRASNGSLPGARAELVDTLDQPYLDDSFYDSRTTVQVPYGWRSGVHPPGSPGLAAARPGGRGSSVGRAGSSVGVGAVAAADGRSSLVLPAAASLSLAMPRSSVVSSGGGGSGDREAAAVAGGPTERLWTGSRRVCALSLGRQSVGVVVGVGVEEAGEDM